jgi:serine/threonine protein kinase
MTAPTTSPGFLDLISKSELVEPERFASELEALRAAGPLPDDAKDLAQLLVQHGLLTFFQADQLLKGRWRGFMVGKYKILERLGAGGMGIVYLAEHRYLLRRVALKVLPLALAEDRWFLEHFYKEAQAVASLHHPNIVCAHDIDRDGKLHFLVMEYVEGSNLEEIVHKHGPMDPARVAHYIRQASLGLQCAHEKGLVHRDIKPGNLVLDRQGVIKILDLGLACFSRKHQEEVAKKNGKRLIVGTDDYLAPEQIVDSDDVDGRADIYSLGATAYYMLSGRPPFHDVTLDHHKLIWHLTRSPKPLTELRQGLPEGLVAVVRQMMAKNPWERYQTPAAIAQALAPWTQSPIPLPPTAEMPGLCAAARRSGVLGAAPPSSRRGRSSWIVYNSVGEPSSVILPGTQQPTPAPGNPDDTVKRSGPAAPAPPERPDSY